MQKKLLYLLSVAFLLSAFCLVILLSMIKGSSEPESNSLPDGANHRTDYVKEIKDRKLYYGQQLDERLQSVLYTIYEGISESRETIEIQGRVTPDELERLMYIIQFDCPELFNVETTYNYSQKKSSITTLKPVYCITATEYREMLAEVRKKAEKIVEKIKDLGNYEKEVYIHDHILKNTEYDLKSKNMSNIYGCLMEGKANCKGYSNAFQYLLRLSDIDCGMVIGEAKSENILIGHSWNIISLDGGHYYTDICWDDVIDVNNDIGIDFHYAFFNMTYSEMIAQRNIYNQLKFLGEIPKSTDEKYSYCRKNGLYASSYKKAERIVREKLPGVLSSKNGVFMIQCKNKDIYNKLNSNIASILKKLIKENRLHIKSCGYFKVDTGNMLVIYREERGD